MESRSTGKKSRRPRQMVLVPVMSAAIVVLTVMIGGFVKRGTEEQPNPGHSRPSGESLQLGVQSLDQPRDGTFLIAARGMRDPNFAQTVVFLIDYDVQGAFGLIINRPTRHTLAELWPEIAGLEAHSVYYGGPVFPNRLLVLVRSDDAAQEMRRVIPGVQLGSDELTLKRIIAKGEEEFRTYAGYSGWGPGQLDYEIARGDWHVILAEKRFIFAPQPAEVWEELIQRVDIQVVKLSRWQDAGSP
jgi:putative transcriptional regulator